MSNARVRTYRKIVFLSALLTLVVVVRTGRAATAS